MYVREFYSQNENCIFKNQTTPHFMKEKKRGVKEGRGEIGPEAGRERRKE